MADIQMSLSRPPSTLPGPRRDNGNAGESNSPFVHPALSISHLISEGSIKVKQGTMFVHGRPLGPPNELPARLSYARKALEVAKAVHDAAVQHDLEEMSSLSRRDRDHARFDQLTAETVVKVLTDISNGSFMQTCPECGGQAIIQYTRLSCCECGRSFPWDEQT